jgi:hypothetical protein
MNRPGDVDDPTREYPNYAAGRAEPGVKGADPLNAPESPQAMAEPTAPGPVRRRPGWLRGTVVGGMALAALALLLVAALAIKALPGFDNPFADRTTDRSQPVLLQSMRDLSRYVAADGSFQVIVDLEESKENIPSFLVGKRTLFVGAGTVEAYVDFGSLADGAIKPNADNTAVTITLPSPQLGKAALDMDQSYVVAQQRGLFDRIGGAFSEDPNQQQRVYQLAQQKITAAAQSSKLAERAEENTRKMLDGLLGSLGYTTVTVTFTAP